MKVLIFVSQFYQLGGSERLAVEMAQELNQRGIRADVLSMYSDRMPGVAKATRDLLGRGIPEVRFLGMEIHPPLGSALRAILALRRMLREEKYDLVETSMISPTALASWATQGTRTRHVAGVHHTFSRLYENALRHRLWRASMACNGRLRFYAISDYVAGTWLRYSGSPPAHVRTIYNGIPDDCFDAVPDREGLLRELDLPRTARLALSVARLTKVKGVDTLLAAVRELQQCRDVYLLCVGLPDPSVPGADEVSRLVEQASCDERIRFLGFRKDVPRLLACADVLLHPARREGFGLALVEALAAGAPVVASNVEGIPEVLSGTGSLLVPPGDVGALRSAALTMLDLAPEERARLVARGRQRAEQFRQARRTDAMIQLFEDVLAERF